MHGTPLPHSTVIFTRRRSGTLVLIRVRWLQAKHAALLCTSCVVIQCRLDVSLVIDGAVIRGRLFLLVGCGG
jgi:hypothetical protein